MHVAPTMHLDPVILSRIQFASFDCFAPFSIFTGLGLVSGYALLGAAWLVIKTEGPLQEWARTQGRRCLIGTTLAIVVVSVWTPLVDPVIAARWFSWPNIANSGAGTSYHGRPDLVGMAIIA